jgi:uncharacterized protein with PQ loop repeat
MTRGLHSLLLGDPLSAFLFNPFGMIVLLGLALYLFYAVIVIAVRLPRLRWEPLSSQASISLRIVCLALIALNWIYLILHERVIAVLR